jgi:putative transposase
MNGLAALLGGHALHATRPRHFFRPQGPMPTAVTLRLALPSELGDPQQQLDELRAQVAATEAAMAAERMRIGARILGRRMILRQAWRDCPVSRAPRRNLRPRIAARSQWARLEAFRRNREFLAAYRDARARWVAGDAIPFPVGTYWLRRFAHVPLAS